jgi:four helix bundle protein
MFDSVMPAFTMPSTIRSYRDAAGSLTELETQIELCVRLELMSNGKAKPLFQACDEVSRMVGSLRRRIQALRPPRP